MRLIPSQIQDLLKIPTICQRLFYRGVELEDNDISVASLQLLANDVLDLQEENEVHEISDSDEAPKKKRREEGQGFGGTLLGGTIPQAPTPMELLAPSEDVQDAFCFEKSCHACTFANPSAAPVCSMCNTVFV
jgi:ubiquitin carboxyl-terminal hydrolase 48